MSTNKFLVGTALLSLLGACGGDADNLSQQTQEVAPPPPPASATFEVRVTNLTNAQPLSPVALVAHDGSFRAFELGQRASEGLEVLAEGGDTSQFVGEAELIDGVLGTTTGTDPVGPGASDTLTFTTVASALDGLSFSLATMLVNTNDAFTGLNSLDVGALAPGESIVRTGLAYDAGTEADTEAAGTIPGPAVGGEGYNALRDDEADRIAMHTGVLSNQDGLPTSMLSAQARFDNPVLEIQIVRVE